MILRREALTILDAISNLSDKPFSPQSKTLIGRGGWRLRVVSYRVICTLSSRDITLFVVKVARRKNINKGFLQNEANVAARRELPDKASYQYTLL